MLLWPAFASAQEPAEANSRAVASWVQARVAANAGDADAASASYARALGEEPGNTLIASEALTHAVLAGEWPLALNAARNLENAGELLPDGRFVLLAEAFSTENWAEASRLIDAIAQDEIFAFTVPVLRAWLSVGTGDGNPAVALSGVGQGNAAIFAAEHLPLVFVATGKLDDAEDLARITEAMGGRAQRLRIGMAFHLATKGKREAALALLNGEDVPLTAARRLIEKRATLPGAIGTPAAGVAELFVRMALDLQLQNLSDLAMSFGRLATFLAPDNGQAWLVTAELMGINGRFDAALAAVDEVTENDPFAGGAAEQRIRYLIQGGDEDLALAFAEAAVNSRKAAASDWARLGQVYTEVGRHAEAAEAFGSALAIQDQDPTVSSWFLWLLRGSALDQAGQWPEAKASLYEAYRLAPGQPVVLNHLGYSQLARRENMEEAERMIREASRLDPDNAAITDSLGWSLFLKGEVDEAIPLLEAAARASPDDLEINEHLGDAFYTAGRRIDARFAWRAALLHAEGEDAARLQAKIETGLIERLASR